MDFSTNCDFNTNLISARKLDRANGANIVKVEKKINSRFMEQLL